MLYRHPLGWAAALAMVVAVGGCTAPVAGPGGAIAPAPIPAAVQAAAPATAGQPASASGQPASAAGQAPLAAGQAASAAGLPPGATGQPLAGAGQLPAATLPTRAAMRAFSPLPPLPPDPTNPVGDDERAARLGQRLFYDPGYARGGAVSCATCHQPERAFGDGVGVAVALGTGDRNTPSLLYAGRTRWHGWGGRGDSLMSQSLGALQNPREMDGDRVTAARRFLVRESADYTRLFGPIPQTRQWPSTGRPGEPGWEAMPAARRAEVDRVLANFGHALGAFMRRLEPGPSAFDRYVAGDDAALSPEAVRGFAVFANKSDCAKCHSGPLFSDDGFHNIGVMQSRGTPDLGRATDLATVLKDPFNAAGPYTAQAVPLPAVRPADQGLFHTPTLRNLAATAPYWHNGSFPTLTLALDFDLAGGGAFAQEKHFFPGQQDELLKPIALTSAERGELLAFLDSLAAGPVPAPWGTRPE